MIAQTAKKIIANILFILLLQSSANTLCVITSQIRNLKNTEHITEPNLRPALYLYPVHYDEDIFDTDTDDAYSLITKSIETSLVITAAVFFLYYMKI